MLEELSKRVRRFDNDPGTSRSWFEGVIGGTCLQSDARHVAKLCVADITPPCEVRQDETDQETVWTVTQPPRVRIHRVESY